MKKSLFFFLCFSFPFSKEQGGRTLRNDVFPPSKHLLSAFYKTLPAKNPSKNLIFTENLCRRLLRTLHLLLENLLRTFLRSVLLHDPLGVHLKAPRVCPAVSAVNFAGKSTLWTNAGQD